MGHTFMLTQTKCWGIIVLAIRVIFFLLLYQKKRFGGNFLSFVVDRNCPGAFLVFDRFPYSIANKKTEIVAAYVISAFKWRRLNSLVVCKRWMFNTIFQYFSVCLFYRKNKSELNARFSLYFECMLYNLRK